MSVNVTSRPETGAATMTPEAGHDPASVKAGIFSPAQLVTALPGALRKLDPRHLARNPVMFVVFVGSVVTTVMAVTDPSVFSWAVVAWLWFTVLFANLAESVAEGRGKAQAASLRKVKQDTVAHRITASGRVESVAGITSPASTTTRSPTVSSVPATDSTRPLAVIR